MLNRALLDYGLYRASDWAILTDTTPAQVERILSQYHLCSHYEVAEAVELLRRFHQVYSRDRLQQTHNQLQQLRDQVLLSQLTQEAGADDGSLPTRLQVLIEANKTALQPVESSDDQPTKYIN